MKNRGSFIGILIILQLFISIPLTDASRKQISVPSHLNKGKMGNKRNVYFTYIHGKRNGKKKSGKKKTQKTLEPIETTLEPIQTTVVDTTTSTTTENPTDCEMIVYSGGDCDPFNFVFALQGVDGEKREALGLSIDAPLSILMAKYSQTVNPCEFYRLIHYEAGAPSSGGATVDASEVWSNCYDFTSDDVSHLEEMSIDMT